MNRFSNAFVCVALLAGACKSSKDSTGKAADRVDKEQTALTKDVDKKVDKAIEGVGDLAKKVGDVNLAQDDFATKRDARVATLRAFHAIDATNLIEIKLLAGTVNLTEPGRIQLAEKLALAELRIDEAGKMIEQMPTATAATWNGREREMSATMVRLRDAIDAGFASLRDAPRLPPSAS